MEAAERDLLENILIQLESLNHAAQQIIRQQAEMIDLLSKK